MRAFFILAALLIPLSGCSTIGAINTADVAIANATASSQFRKVCSLRGFVVAGFELLRTQVTISDRVTSRFYQLSSSMQVVCINPPSNIREALSTATRLYTDLLNSQEGLATVVAAKLGK